MDILKGIESARSIKSDDNAIVQEILRQNPEKRARVELAISRGANATDIVNEIIKQNKLSSQSSGSVIEQNINRSQSEETMTPEPKKQTFLGNVGRFFTGKTQQFADTLGAAASVIDPKTKKLREEAINSTNNQVDSYLAMAKNETDKDRKDKLLKAAMSLADTEDIDIFNRPEYQKTAKQIYGEGLGVATEILGWGKVSGILKGAKGVTAAKTILKSVATGTVIGASTSTAEAMTQNKSTKDIVTSGLIGTAIGAGTGAAGGYIAGKLSSKLGSRSAVKLVSPRLTSKGKSAAYQAGKATERSLLRAEKIAPNKAEKELANLAQDINLKTGKTSSNVAKANKEIVREAEALKKILKDKGAIYNKNNVKGALNKMKSDKTIDLIEPEIKVYDKMIAKFNKLVENSKNKGLDGLLELRQKFDKQLLEANPNIFNNKNTGAYRALKGVRDAVNGYINKQAGDDIVSASLKKQTGLYRIISNISDKQAFGKTKLKSSVVGGIRKKYGGKVAATGAAALGINWLGKKFSSNSSSNSSYTPRQ